jgi:SAM-dependent methyltransferase
MLKSVAIILMLKLLLFISFIIAEAGFCAPEKPCQKCVVANSPQFIGLPRVKPQLSRTGKALLSTNRFGFYIIGFETNWTLETFYEFCKEHNNGTILDIGVGCGGSSKNALSYGPYVIANDLSLLHLAYFIDSLSEEQKKHCWLNLERFPDINIKDNSLDGILIHRIIHFLSGDEIMRGFKNAYRWLNPGGKIFIVCMGPEHILLRHEFLPHFNQEKKKGNPWPGMWLDVRHFLPQQHYALPDQMHILDEEILAWALKDSGFIIEKSGYIALKKVGIEENRDGREAVGVIAVKPA